MDSLEKLNHIQNLKDARDSFFKNSEYYHEVFSLFNSLIQKLEQGLDSELNFLKTRYHHLSHKLKNQNLEERQNFVNLNKFNEFDLQCLCGLLTNNIANNFPVLELFPGTGQFLPYAVAGEPLYIADRYIEICNEAARNLQNQFYESRRLRKYIIKNDNLSNLPANSFGLIYCFNEFFMANEDYILQIAKQMLDLLYAGGKFVFNFMPHDQIWSKELSMSSNFTTVNYKLLIDELTIMGYTVTNFDIRQLKSSFIVAQKKGEAKERYKINGGLAEIIDL